MRVRLDDGKSYNLLDMFTPRIVGFSKAYEALRGNYSAWKYALMLPARVTSTFSGTALWMLVFILHSVSLLLLLPLFFVGVSMRSYTYFQSDDKKKLPDYQTELKRIYQAHQHIDDPEEYSRRVNEEIAKIKPFKPR